MSIGIQSLDETALRALGRQHSPATRSRLWIWPAAVSAGVVDLIYARPGQDLAGLAGGIEGGACDHRGPPFCL